MAQYKNEKFKVSTQAITEDLKNNGDFGTSLDYGTMNPEELMAFLESSAKVVPLTPKKNEELCPPNIIIDCGDMEYYFSPDGETLFCSDPEKNFTPEEAFLLCAGEVKASQLNDAPESKNFKSNTDSYKPLRKKDLEPTNRDNYQFRNQNINHPDISLTIYKSQGWKYQWIGTVGAGIFLTLGGIFAVGSKLTNKDSTIDGTIAFVLLGLGIGIIALGFLLKKFSKETLTAGFDWKENVFWYYRSSRQDPFYVANANCIEKFGYEIQKSTEVHRNNYEDRTELHNVSRFYLTVKSTGADFWALMSYLDFSSKKELETVMEEFNKCLDKQ